LDGWYYDPDQQMKLGAYCVAIGIGLLALAGCGKQKIDIDTLTNNPFDPDYAGPSLFELADSRTVTYTVDGQVHYDLEVDIRVREDLFLSPIPEYEVYVTGTGVSPEAFSGHPLLTFTISDVGLGAVICRDLALRRSQGGQGASNSVCAIAAL